MEVIRSPLAENNRIYELLKKSLGLRDGGTENWRPQAVITTSVKLKQCHVHVGLIMKIRLCDICGTVSGINIFYYLIAL